MGAIVMIGAATYAVLLLCAPLSLGRHRHPLHAAHCRASGFRRGSREDIRAFDMMNSIMMLARWTAAATFAFSDPRLLAAVVSIEALLGSLWAGQRLRMVVRRRARKLRREAA